MKKVLLTILLLMLVSCATTRRVIEKPVVVSQDHTEYASNNVRDTVIVRDSIHVVDSVFIKEKGDTVYYYKTNIQYRYKTEYRDVVKTDTLCVRDSIPYPVVVTEYKEVVTNKLTWLQRTLMYTGILALVLILGIIGFKCFKLYLKK